MGGLTQQGVLEVAMPGKKLPRQRLGRAYTTVD